VFRKRVPGVGSGNWKSSASDGSQSDWGHDQTKSDEVLVQLSVWRCHLEYLSVMGIPHGQIISKKET